MAAMPTRASMAQRRACYGEVYGIQGMRYEILGANTLAGESSAWPPWNSM